MSPRFPFLFALLALLVPALPADSLDCWRFPTLRTAYREGFLLSRALRTDGWTTETLARAAELNAGSPAQVLAAYGASTENTTSPTLTQAGVDRWRTEALLLLKNPELRWGAQGLWNPLVNGPNTSPEDLPNYLLDQFYDDNVAWNSTNAAEIYVAGLQEDPERFAPPLVARWEKLAGSGARDQTGAFTASLLLIYGALDERDLDDSILSWHFLSYGGLLDHNRRVDRLEPRARRAVLSAAMVCAPNGNRTWQDESLDRIAYGNRRMAWRILESTLPLPVKELRAISANELSNDNDVERAALLWMLRDPESLPMPANRDVFLKPIRWYWYTSQPRTYDLLFDDTAGDKEYWRGSLEWRLKDLFFCDPIGDLELDIATVLPWREKYLEAVRETLRNETNQRRQLALASFLYGAKDPESRDLVQMIMVSNFVDDDWGINAAVAESTLMEMGEEAIVSLRAGLTVGIGEADWQLVDRCTNLLLALDRDFSPVEFPDGIPMMIGQLADDDIHQNAAAARRFLVRCGDQAIPALQVALETGDDQTKDYAARILDDINWINHLEPDFEEGLMPLPCGMPPTSPQQVSESSLAAPEPSAR